MFLKGKSFKSITVGLIMVVGLSLIFGMQSNAAAKTITIKLGWTTSDGATDPYAITARQFAAALEKEAPGQFNVEFFPNRALGDEKEMLEGLSFGTLNMAVITNAPIASIEPAFQINDLPFLYADENTAHAVLDGEAGQKLMKKLESKNIIGFGFAEGGFRQMINNVRAIETLGGNAVPMAWGEVFTAVQQGTIDGLEIPIAVIQNNGYYEVTKYLSLTNHTYSALGVLMSKKTWDQLTPAQQTAVRKAARTAIEKERAMNMENVRKLVDKLQQEGMQVNQVKNPASFQQKVKPVYEEFRQSIGDEIYNLVMGQM